LTKRNPFAPTTKELHAIRKEAMDFAGIAIYRFRPDGTILFIDGGTLHLLDLQDEIDDPSVLVGRDIGTLFEYVAQPRSFRDEVLRDGQVRGFEYTYRTLKGDQRWVNHDAFVVRDPETGEQAIQVICHDVTPRRRAVAALERSEAQIRALLSAIPDMMFRVDREGTFLEYFAHEDSDLYAPPETIVGGNIRDLLPPQMAERSLACVHKALATGEPVALEYTLEMEGETRHFESRHVRAADDECVAIVRNMTELQRAHEERLRLEVAVQQAQKLESLGLLAGGIAHDFNNLLTGILGETDLLLSGLPAGTATHERLERIQQTARRAAELTSALLAYTGRTNLERRVLDLSALTADMARLLETVVGHQAELRLQPAHDPVKVEVDATQLRQVVMNLVTNAADACVGLRDAVVVIATGVLDVEGGELASMVGGDELVAGEYAYLEIRDSGMGMEPETVPQIFDPFFTSKDSGRGLGLATVRGIVRAHGGAIDLRTEPGFGSTFRVILPRSEAPLTPTEDASLSLRMPMGIVGTTVLVVDDEEAVRAVTRAVLEREGAMVEEAADGEAAVELLARDPDAIDLVLLDVTMPGMSGFETLDALRLLNEDLPVVMISGYMEPGVSLEARGTERVRFLHKPFRIDGLLENIAKALRER
jgi:two-component system, cell cycle sensor histidine kinase and response regulator CckA